MHDRPKDIPLRWFQGGALSEEEAFALLQPTALVAQKCTGRSKKPVFLFPTKVVKGPWLFPTDRDRLLRELGRSALMEYWALPENPCPVVPPRLFQCPKTGGVYLVTPALYPPPTEVKPWVIESESRSVSGVGPAILRVVGRASTGVIRVSDRVAEEPSYLLKHPAIWEHLSHRHLLHCGDSGLHNMLVRASDDHPVGIDLDENRGDPTAPLEPSWEILLFKKPPAKGLFPILLQSLKQYQGTLARILSSLEAKIADTTTAGLLAEHRLHLHGPEARLQALRIALQRPFYV